MYKVISQFLLRFEIEALRLCIIHNTLMQDHFGTTMLLILSESIHYR
jgi:hypothetical protein